MQLELRPETIKRLLALPENGMGYQLVDLVLVDGRVVPGIQVFNCEIANLPDALHDITATDIADVRPARSKLA